MPVRFPNSRADHPILAAKLLLLGTVFLGLGRVVAEEKQATREASEVRKDALGDPLPPGALLRIGTTRLRHQDSVRGVAIAPDGKTVISGSGDRTLRMWDSATGREIRRFAGSLRYVDSLALSPDGKILVAAGPGERDAIVRRWEVATGRELAPLGGTELEIPGCLVFSPDGRTLVGGGRKVYVWEVDSGKLARAFEAPVRKLNTIAFSPDGRLLACGGDRSYPREEDFTVRLVDAATGKEVWKDRGPARDGPLALVGSVAFSPDGKVLVAAGAAEAILYDAATGKRLRAIKGRVFRVAFSPDGAILASGSPTVNFWEPITGIKFWDPTTGKVLRELPGHGFSITSLAFSSDGKTLVSGGDDQAVRLWDVRTGAERHVFPGHEYHVAAAAYLPDGHTLASVAGDSTLRLWNAHTGEERRRFDFYPLAESGRKFTYSGGAGRDPQQNVLTVSPDGRMVAALMFDIGGTFKTALHLLDPVTGKQLPQLTGTTGGFATLFSPDGTVLATADKKGIARLWNPTTGRVLRSLGEPTGERRLSGVFSLAYDPAGKVLAAGCGKRTICLWDSAEGKEVARFEHQDASGQGNRVNGLAFAPDGKMLVSTLGSQDQSNEGGILLWDMDTRTPAGELKGHAKPVYAVAFSPDGKLLASAGKDGTVRLWEVATRAEVVRFAGHADTASTVTFSPDGLRLVSGSHDTTLLVWDVLAAPGTADQTVADTETAKLGGLWADLAGDDPARAYRAACILANAPGPAVRLLRDRLRPAPHMKPKTVPELLADLNDEEFAVREAATAALLKLGGKVVPALREALVAPPSAEVRRRLKRLLDEIPAAKPLPEDLRIQRAIQVLERIGTADARDVLRALAKGSAEADQTRDAREALRRLEARPEK